MLACQYRNSTCAYSKWHKGTIIEAQNALTSNEISSRELTELCISQIEKTRVLNMFITDMFAEARATADASDTRRQHGNTIGALDGIPMSLKDNYCTKDIPTTAGSSMLKTFRPPYESTVSQTLLDQGVVLLGKCNMDEFAMGSGTTFSAFGPTINPWSGDPLSSSSSVVAGGSSGGSAAAVASGCCFASIGSDTGGSVRQVSCLSSSLSLSLTLT
jgi:aspartyl-tRNA(Asn)/glutamyl-tRNA(Gln) amidotransferase subunit A